jgi:hypothetical protein
MNKTKVSNRIYSEGHGRMYMHALFESRNDQLMSYGKNFSFFRHYCLGDIKLLHILKTDMPCLKTLKMSPSYKSGSGSFPKEHT